MATSIPPSNSQPKIRAVVLGGGGFIGGHLARRLKRAGYSVRIADIKLHDYFESGSICDEFCQVDLRDPVAVAEVIRAGDDEVYQLAADMGGAGYLFTGDNDANVMHNSAAINLNVANECARKRVGKVFYSSSACVYPEHNQLDPSHPNCVEDSVYPASPDSEYGWEKLFSERMYLAFARNHKLDVRIARFHNIFGPQGTWTGGKEKAPAAILRKVGEAVNGDSIEIWGDGQQTRSFMFVEVCVEAVLRLMASQFSGPVNIGSERMLTLNELATLAISISGKDLQITNLTGSAFFEKYGFACPIGVNGRNSDNRLYREQVGWECSEDLEAGLRTTYQWIQHNVANQATKTNNDNAETLALG